MIVPNEKLMTYVSDDKSSDDVNSKKNAGADEPPPYEMHGTIQVERAVMRPHAAKSYPPQAIGGSMPAPASAFPAMSPPVTKGAAPFAPAGGSTPPLIPAMTQVFQPTNAQRVNHFSLFSRHNAISGTFLVDPSLPASPQTTSFSGKCVRKIERRDRSADRAHARNTRRAFGSNSDPDDSSTRGWGSWGRTPEVNAVFRTRHGQITVDVAVVGPTPAASGTLARMKNERARLMLSSRHGSISVNLFEIQPGHCVDLDVSTRHGSMVILLPPTFDGVIMVHTRGDRNQVRFLQAFAERARTVRAHDRETHIVLSPNALTTGQEGEDRCVVSTRHGKVTFGLSGFDKADGVLLGGGRLFKMLGDLLQLGAKKLEVSLSGSA